MIAGVLTANELALLRARPQRTQLYLAIPEYHVVWSGRVNGTPVSNDSTHQVAFNFGGTGGGAALTDVKRNMTLLVGSSAFGDWDIGIARIRQDAAGGDVVFYIGITSDIPFADGQYLTVIDDFSLWPVHPWIDPTTEIVYMDYSIAYAAAGQNRYGAAVPILGTHAVVELPPGGTVTVGFDASGSYACIGTPTYSFAWACVGATFDNAAIAAPTLTFNAAGTYLVKLIVTANHGGGILKTSTAYRYVIVHDAAHPLNASFALESCEGDFENGGWSYRVTMNAKASEIFVRDRTLCILVAKDWYDNTQQSIGPLVGRENIVCVGWVNGESLRRSNDKSLVSFEIQGPAFWLGVQEGFPTGIDDTDVAPADWSHIQALDPRRGLFSFLHWRTTSTAVMDCIITADDHRLATTYTPAGSLLEQLRAIAEKINARTVCDRYGRLFCEIDTQFIEPTLRVPPTFPVVQTLTNRDWRDEITIERRAVSRVGQVDLSGVFYTGDITTSIALFSLSPGHYPKHHGGKEVKDRIALDDQAEANLLAGLWNGYLNNEFPTIDTPMSSNYRAVDIAPRMFVQMNMAAGDTPRGIVWTDKKLIPRRVSFNYDSREAVLLTDVTFEAESFPSDAVTGDPPLEPPEPPIDVPPKPPILCDDPFALNFGLLAPCVYPPSQYIFIHNHKHILRCLNFFTLTVPAVWDEITVTGFSQANDIICSLSIDPDGFGAWLVTIGTNLNTTGIFRTNDIQTGSFSLVYSQQSALTDGQAYKVSVGFTLANGWAQPPAFGELRSCTTMGNGKACFPEVMDPGANDRPATCVFTTLDAGATWIISVPYFNTTPYNGNKAFWCDQYFNKGCHQIDWDGSQVYISGLDKTPTFVDAGAVMSSPDGQIPWTKTDALPVLYINFYSCNAIAGNIYCHSSSSNRVILLPTAPATAALTYSFGFRRTQFGGELVYIRHILGSITWINTELYSAVTIMDETFQLLSGGAVETVVVVNGGTGGTYAPGDILTLALTDGGTAATVTVLSVVGAQVATVLLTNPGTGYRAGTYATTGGGGTGCTISVVTLTDYIPPFGIARIVAPGEIVVAARDVVTVGGEVVTYMEAGVKYNRSGNLLAEIGMDWEGTVVLAGNAMDASGIEYM